MRAVEGLRLDINAETGSSVGAPLTVNQLIEHYRKVELGEKNKKTVRTTEVYVYQLLKVMRKRPVLPSGLGVGVGLTISSWLMQRQRERYAVAVGCREASDCRVDVGVRRECGGGGAGSWGEREPGVQVAACLRAR